MVDGQTGVCKPQWTLRDWLAGIGLFAATAAVVLWQNAHVAVLWDLSYTLDSAARIAAGQVPYRDFPFVHPPLTFLIQAAIMRLTGRVYFHHVLYAACAGGLGTVLAWRIALHSLRGRVDSAWTLALILAAPLTVLGNYCILPLPSYDCDTALAVLVAICLLQRLTPPAAGPASPLRSLLAGFVTGAALCLPLFFKQNIGIPFLAAACAIILLTLAATRLARAKSAPRSAWTPLLLAVLAGVGATLLFAAALIHFTAGIGNYVHWTIQFAAQRRLPSFGLILSVYRDSNLLWTLPCILLALVLLRSPVRQSLWARWSAFALMSAPFACALSSLWLYDDADERGDSLLALWPLLLILAAALAVNHLLRLRRHAGLSPFLPILALAAIHGTFMSQQLWGSTYAIWPLLVLLIAELIAYLARFSLAERKTPSLPFAMAVVIAITLLVCGGFYTASEERLSYAQFPDGPVQHSAFPELKGLSTPGPWLPDFDELLRYAAASIPPADGVILLPGEDPFYFATGRIPQFPVLLFDPSTDPYSPAQLAQEVRHRQIRWLIVKRDLQIKEDSTPQPGETMKLLLQDFKLSARLQGYDVYRR
jgi:hypothetical protein